MSVSAGGAFFPSLGFTTMKGFQSDLSSAVRLNIGNPSFPFPSQHDAVSPSLIPLIFFLKFNSQEARNFAPPPILSLSANPIQCLPLCSVAATRCAKILTRQFQIIIVVIIKLNFVLGSQDLVQIDFSPYNFYNR